MKTRVAIGAHRDADLRYINDPVSQYYIPYPTVAMTCAELKFFYDKLDAQILQWIDWQQYETNATAVSNIDQIISIQSEKQTQYATKIAEVCPPDQPTGGGTTATKNNSLLWILIAAAAALFLLMKKKKQAA